MNPLMLILSVLFGLLPLNRTKRDSIAVVDYGLMLVIPVAYLACYFLVNFGEHGVYQLKNCDSICRLGNILFMHLGCFLYLSIYMLSLRRGKEFFVRFQCSLDEIDATIVKCQKLTSGKNKSKPTKNQYGFYLTWTFVFIIFAYALYYDVTNMLFQMQNAFIISVMITAFPFFAGSIVQGQFIYYVAVIMDRFNGINNLLEAINQECEHKNAPLAVFDIESNTKKDEKLKGPAIITEVAKQKDDDKSDSSDDNDDDDEDGMADEERGTTQPSDGHTSEANLPELFKLHDKILSLSVLTNSEFGAQCVPYMTVCFVIGIFGIFLETKVIFIVGGKSQLLDYVAQIYVIWSLLMMVVAYLVLRLCCNANGKSKNSAMIVHEIMQKKPAFMLGNDLYYNKMKSFTLQFLHWEGFFQFNGIGLFALDYTFIFSTVSAATSYLIVLLQFDMSSILKNEGLL